MMTTTPSMLQINNLSATVADKPILKGLALSLSLVACSGAASNDNDCASLAQQRQRDVSQLMREFKAVNPRAKATDQNGYPALRDSEGYLEFQAKLERIESAYHAKCPEPK